MYDQDDIMQFFNYAHLPAHLQEVSKRFHEMAGFLMDLPACRERQKALDALLMAKDAAVRAKLVEQRLAAWRCALHRGACARIECAQESA